MADVKRKRGRPRHPIPLKRRCLSMTDDQLKLLRIWGRGDASAGLRWLIDQAAAMVQKIS